MLKAWKNYKSIKGRGSEKKKSKFDQIWCPQKILFGHSGKINCFSSSLLYNFFASGSADGSIRLWSYKSLRPISVLARDFGGINCLSFDEKFGNLFSGGDEMQIKCWDIEKQKISRTFKGHFSNITSLKVHPLLNILVSGGRDCVVRVWDIRVKKEIKILDFHKNTISSILINEKSPHLISSSLDGTICLWDFVLDAPIGLLSSHKRGVQDLKKNPSEFSFISLSSDSLILWRLDGSLVKKIPGSRDDLSCLALNQNGEVAVSRITGWVKIFRYNESIQQQNFRSFSPKNPTFFSKNISTVHFSPKGDQLLLGKENNTIVIFQKKWQKIES